MSAWRARSRADSRVSVECPVQTPEFVAGQKAGERGAPVHGYVARGIDVDMTAGDGEFENLAQDAQRVIGAAGSGVAVGVEPVQNVIASDAVERRCAEGGQELAGQVGVHAVSCRRLVPGEVGVLPWSRDEVPEQRHLVHVRFVRMFGVGPGHECVAFPARVVDAH